MRRNPALAPIQWDTSLEPGAKALAKVQTQLGLHQCIGTGWDWLNTKTLAKVQ